MSTFDFLLDHSDKVFDYSRLQSKNIRCLVEILREPEVLNQLKAASKERKEKYVKDLD